MASAELAIDTVALDRDAADLSQCLGRAGRELDGLMEALTALNRMWDGPANKSFDAQFRIDAGMMAELQETVGRLIADMRSAAAEYRKCGNSVADAIAAVKI